MPNQLLELPFSQLRGYVDAASLPFEHTGLLEAPEEKIVGQTRASDAIKFGMGMKSSGYHIFVAGPSKAGLTYTARTYVEEQAKKEPTPPDWCYVYNFKEPDRPKSIKLSAGRGKELKKDMQELIEAVQQRISEVFESEEYTAKEAEVHKDFEKHRREVIEELSHLAKEEGFMLQVSQVGMMIIPATKEGIPMSQDKLGELTDEEKQKLREKSDEVQGKMKEAVKKIREAEAAFKEQHRELENNLALSVVSQIMEPYLDKFKEEPGVLEHLKAVQTDVLENIGEFRKKEEAQQPQIPQFQVPQKDAVFRK